MYRIRGLPAFGLEVPFSDDDQLVKNGGFT